MTVIAERLAREAHAGQVERLTGDPYIRHIERVVARVAGDEAQAIAWLHDVLEDSDLTAADLRAAGLSEAVVEAVRLLTRTPPYDYPDYIRTLLDEGSDAAIAVKIADVQDHLRPMEPEVLTPVRRRKYTQALRLLTIGAQLRGGSVSSIIEVEVAR